MINNHLDYEAHKALEAILRHHGVDDSGALLRDLSTFANWVREDQMDKARLNRIPQAPFLISLLSGMGIYGAGALEPRKEPAT